MKIGIFETKEWEKPLLEKKLKGHTLKFFTAPLTPQNVSVAKPFDVVAVFIASKLNKKVISQLPHLKLITTMSTGYDHVDLKVAKKAGVTVCNVPTYGENTVAEHTFALILALSRNVHKSHMRTVQDNFSTEGLMGFDLKGKTLGVVGAGHIGLHVIRIAKGFGMEVLAFDAHRNTFLSEVMDFQYASMDTLLKKADIVTLHVPYNKHTHHLINKSAFQKMKKGSILINTSRGAIVDTKALLESLNRKKLAGAGLDVVEGEDLIKEERQVLQDQNQIEKLMQVRRDHALFDKENVVYTPHIAFYSQEALQRILETTVENILHFKEGEPKNIIM